MIKRGDILISRIKLLNAINRARQLHQLLMILSSPTIQWDWITQEDFILANRN